MYNRFAIRVLSIIVLVVSMACAVTGAQPTATPTLDLPATQKAEAALTETQQAKEQATAAAQGTADAQATLDAQAHAQATADSQATADAQAVADQATASAKSTDEAIQQVTETAQAARTQSAQQTAEAKATQVASATARASSMFDLVVSLKDQGVIDTTGGKYFLLPDFDEKWAQLGWYMYWPTGYSPTNFVLRTDAAWESASSIAEWNMSGCGLVFHYTDNDNQAAAFFTMDGKARLFFFRDGRYGESGSGNYGKLNTPNPDSAEFVLVVQDNFVDFFVNGKHLIVNKQVPSELSSGELATTLLSGTNKDYGTHCTMTDIELWELP